MNKTQTNTNWAIPNLLPTGLTILAGAPKIGKSWLALQIAHAVAAGGNTLGEDVEKGRVLYLALDDSEVRLQGRMNKQGWTRGLEADFLTMGKFVWEKGLVSELTRRIKTRGYRLVVIDTLLRAVRGNQKAVKEMLTALQEIAYANNCAVLVIDYHKKGCSGSDAIGDILGSKGVVFDAYWGLYRERGQDEANLAIAGHETGKRNLSLRIDWLTGTWQKETRGNYNEN